MNWFRRIFLSKADHCAAPPGRSEGAVGRMPTPRESPMVRRRLTLEDLGTLLATENGDLEPTLKAQLSPFRCNPSRIPCVRAGVLDPDSMWVVARAGEHVLLYDSVEEEFGAGVVDRDGVLRDWGTSGPKLRRSVARF